MSQLPRSHSLEVERPVLHSARRERNRSSVIHGCSGAIMAQNARRCPGAASHPSPGVNPDLFMGHRAKGPQLPLKGRNISQTTSPWCEESLQAYQHPHLPIIPFSCFPPAALHRDFQSNTERREMMASVAVTHPTLRAPTSAEAGVQAH